MTHVRRHPKAANHWQVRDVDPIGKERARYFTRGSDAERFLHTVEVKKLRSEWTYPEAGRISFADWNGPAQVGRVNLASSTRARDASVLASMVLPAFGSMPPVAIEPQHVRACVAGLVDDGYAPSTVRRAYILFQMAMEMAVEDGRLPRSPCRRIALPKAEQKETRFLSASEVAELADAIDLRYRAFVLTAAYRASVPASWRPCASPASTSSAGSSEWRSR